MSDTMLLADGFSAEFRGNGSVAIFHERGGLHMAQSPEIAMAHEIRRLRAQVESLTADAGRYKDALLEAMNQAVACELLDISKIGPMHWFSVAQMAIDAARKDKT